MEIRKEDLQQTIEDIALIRRSIGGVEREEGQHWGWSRVTAKLNIVLQLCALGLALGLLVGEFFYGHMLTLDFIRSMGNSDYQFLYIWQTGLALALLIGVVYFVTYIASRKNNQEFSEYVAKNFTYLKNFSLFSDMFVKFSVFALLILADKPFWIFPLFFLFIADYLFQGRLFTLPTNLSLVLGLVYVAFAFIQFFVASWYIVWPLAGFVAVCILSLGYSYKQNSLIEKHIQIEA